MRVSPILATLRTVSTLQALHESLYLPTEICISFQTQCPPIKVVTNRAASFLSLLPVPAQRLFGDPCRPPMLLRRVLVSTIVVLAVLVLHFPLHVDSKHFKEETNITRLNASHGFRCNSTNRQCSSTDLLILGAVDLTLSTDDQVLRFEVDASRGKEAE